jgi:hypothetical protein
VLLYDGTGLGGDGLFLISVEDGVRRRLPTSPNLVGELRPTGWTPDGKRFLFHNGGWTHVVDVDTEATTLLLVAVGQPSNDGTRVAGFQEATGAEPGLQVCVVPIDGGSCVPTGTPADAPTPSGHMRLQWLPNDDWILTLPESPAAAVLLDPDGGPPVRPPWLRPSTEVVQRVAPP